MVRMSLCPINFWIVTRSVPMANRWEAKEWRNEWRQTFLWMPAFSMALVNAHRMVCSLICEPRSLPLKRLIKNSHKLVNFLFRLCVFYLFRCFLSVFPKLEGVDAVLPQDVGGWP